RFVAWRGSRQAGRQGVQDRPSRQLQRFDAGGHTVRCRDGAYACRRAVRARRRSGRARLPRCNRYHWPRAAASCRSGLRGPLVSAGDAVATRPLLALVAFAGVIVLLLFLIARWRWHVFLALLVPLLLFGVVPGVATNNFIAAFERGFGSTLGSIGVVIVLGSVIAEGLRHTGAIQTITRTMVNAIGARRMPLALTLTGFVLGVAIFSDVAYVILNPLVHSAAKLMGVTVSVMSIGLVGALQLTHAIVPPTPGPLAAAALVGADIGKTIIFGSIACLFGSIAAWLWGQYVAGPRMKTPASDDFAGEDLLGDNAGRTLPGAFE